MNQGLGLGIRALPPTPDITAESEQGQFLNSPFNDKIDADTTFGQSAHSYDSAAMTRSFNVESSTSKVTTLEVVDRMKLRRILRSNVKFASENVKLDDPEEFSLLPYVRSAETPPNTPRPGDPARSSGPSRGRRYVSVTVLIWHFLVTANQNSDKSLRSNHELRSSGPSRGRRYVSVTVLTWHFLVTANQNSDKSLRSNHEIRSSLNLDEITDELEHDPEVLQDLHPNHSSSPHSGSEFDGFTDISLTATDGSATAMELCEENAQEFGADPLVVGNGIALTEEAVEMHVPGIMAQF